MSQRAVVWLLIKSPRSPKHIAFLQAAAMLFSERGDACQSTPVYMFSSSLLFFILTVYS